MVSIFLSNANNLFTVTWYQSFLSNKIIYTQLYGIKYSFLIQIIHIQINGIKKV